MMRTALGALISLTILAGCAGGGTGGDPVGRHVVVVTQPPELLKLRAGPGLGYKVILGLPNGTALTRRDCVTEIGQLWCRVSLASAPGVSGYVSADYLSTP
ncbi:MAG: SH3 domain-containing protein [Roseivivax sp.]|nr:SH3 domain-containing protein [Roseivivax sp.]